MSKKENLQVRFTTEELEKIRVLAEEEDRSMSALVRLLTLESLKNKNKGEIKMKKLDVLKARYEEIMDEVNLLKANGSLSRLANLRTKFDETFDIFFDDEKLRKKYKAWDEEEECIDTNYSNDDLEGKLDNVDLKKLCEFYEEYIASLEEERDELKNGK